MQTRRIHWQVFWVLLFSGFGSSLCCGQATQVSVTGPESVGVAIGNKSSVSKVSTPPICPPAGLLSLQPGSRGTGDHTVTLSWNASIAPPHSKDDAAGYCIYRSQKQSAAHKNPTCSKCERVNVVPLASLSCVDNVVEDGVTYYYVVTAISPSSSISSASNEVTVPIGGSREEKTTSGNSPPLCRVNPVAR